MKYYYSGIKDSQLIKIFNELKDVLELTGNYFPNHPPYTFTEGATTGYIVSACGRLNYAAIQEYRTKSKTNEIINYGRGALLIITDRNKAFRMEAKQFHGYAIDEEKNFRQIKHKWNKNLVQIESYKQMFQKHYVSENYLSLMYIAPQIREAKYSSNEKLHHDWEEFIKRLEVEYSSQNNFIVSYYNELSSLKFIQDKKEGSKIAHPGLIILGEIIETG